MTLPAPLTPPDCDLQDFPFMPLHVARLRDSDLAAEEHPEGCWYAVMLWSAAWHQLPAGSLPDNETILTRLCGLGRDVKTFRKHRAAAMRGFVLCSDGRFYHSVVAEQANTAWTSKLQQRWRTELARIKKANQRNGTSVPSPTYEEFINGLSPGVVDPGPQDVPGDTPQSPGGQGLQETGTGTGTVKEESFALSSPTAPPERAVGVVGLDGKLASNSARPADVRAAFDEWNELAGRAGLPKARDLTDDRKRHIATRLRANGLDGWRCVLATIEASPFCRGAGERGWRVSLDDLFQTKTWNKLRDGSYGPPAANGRDRVRPEHWPHLVDMWRSGEGWPPEAGPAPDMPGCLAPSHLIDAGKFEDAA